MDNDGTQPATQETFDPRRLGRNNSGLATSDIADVLCILHPSSPAAFRVVAATAAKHPEHILQKPNDDDTFDENATQSALEEQETFVLDSETSENARDLALRLSSRTIQPMMGFCFGRSARWCDIIIGTDTYKRVSNLHFRIFVNNTGVLMLEDMSTNGTIVDDKILKGKLNPTHATRMLQSGSIIHIPGHSPDDHLKFIVRIPQRAGFHDEYVRNLHRYMRLIAEAEQKHTDNENHKAMQQYQIKVPRISNTNPFGMHWDGGEEYNVVGLLGKGAFATVYKLATKRDGLHFAAKELEKKRFIKNGRLDQRLDNEMQIMKSIRHANVVQYINYQDHSDHLYIIMEYVPCGDLQGYLSENRVLPEPEAKLMSRQVLDALNYLHRKQITHRDIKPDNILIADEDPFTIKLSDFGLSKVVNTNETFLKTFCGTLLYCAPEVFPHYEEHLSQKGIKRRRSGKANQRYHSYSQSVDIWSYAAVLWLSMCGKPPFEGVVDQTGRGMFNKIMGTNLDISPLLAYGVSKDAIDLMYRMLNTDPSQRPTETECLQHPWLFDGRSIPDSTAGASRGLRVIAEDEEGAHSVASQAKALSQLSVNDASPARAGANRQLSNVAEADEGHEDDEAPELDSGDFEFLDPRQSKRVKADAFVPRNHVRDQAAIPSSSPEPSESGKREWEEAREHQSHEKPTPKPNRMFGEIGDSALESSGVLDAHTRAALAMESNGEGNMSNGSGMSVDQSGVSYQPGQMTSELYRSDSGLQHPSLMGTESMVRDMHMMEPGNSGDHSDSVNEPQTPKTPDIVSQPSHNTKSPHSQPQRRSHDTTPRQPKVDQVDIGGWPTEPAHFQASEDIPNSGPLTYSPAAHLLTKLPSTLGALQTTPDSMDQVTLELTKRCSHWGRDPSNTFVYPKSMDTRISKRAFTIWFHAWGIDREVREGRDWRIMPGLHTVVQTESSNGILVNGRHLAARDTDGEILVGRLYSGDVITVWKGKNQSKGTPPEHMSFVCEFLVGEAEKQRPEDQPFEPIRAIEPSQQRSSF